MKTKIMIFISAVALVTLSFTFARVEIPTQAPDNQMVTSPTSAQIGGLISDEVVK